MATCRCEIWLAVDQDGDYAVGINKDAAIARYAENISRDPQPMLVTKLDLIGVPRPADIYATGTLPALPDGGVNLTLSIDKIERAG